MDNQDIIFILDAKIQKQRLKDMKEAAKRRKIKTVDTFSSRVTYLVTEYKDTDAVLRKMDKANIDELGNVNLVSVEWFTDCMKAGELVPIQEKHRIQSISSETSTNEDSTASNVYHMADYACQRATPLNHYNKKLTDALEVLELHAELRDDKGDYSRALAFRRASCVLKCLPFTLTSAQQLRRVTNIGDHSRRVIQEILEDGTCTEVEDILHSSWFQKMKLFSGIFGIGSAKAKQFIENGWSSIKEAQEGYKSADWRVQWGLAFHEELVQPVCLQEAEFILSVVKKHVERIQPGVILQLTGGFRRGKSSGHDVDILLTHPKSGKELGLLPRLLHSLQSHDITLCGRHEKSTYTDDVLTQDFKLSMKGQLDHFEKWLGIFKVPKSISEQSKCTVIYERNSRRQAYDNNEKVGDTTSSETSTDDSISNDNVLNVNINGSLGDIQSESKSDKFDHSEIIKLSKEPRPWIARRVDLIVSPYEQYFYALVGWTGNKMFNRDLRLYAQREHGMKLTSHGLYNFNEGRKVPASSEQEVFDHLQVPYREPCDRNC